MAKLRDVIEDPHSSESDICKELRANLWVFGGQFVGEAARRELTTGDVVDIPLIRGDAALQVVELKRADIPKLVVGHRSHSIPGPEVHEAVCQAQNYLRSLDEDRAGILAKYNIECRRSFATVVIGHARFARADTREIAETLRTYNSHMARIEVITFDQLLAGAEQALHLVEPTDSGNSAIEAELWDAAVDPPF